MALRLRAALGMLLWGRRAQEAESEPTEGQAEGGVEATEAEDAYTNEVSMSEDEVHEGCDGEPGVRHPSAEPAFMEATSGFGGLPQLETPLKLDDFHVFRLPDLSRLDINPPIDWRAVALHFANLLKVSEPWHATIKHLDAIITDPATEERASEDQVFMWLLSQSDGCLRQRLLGLRMVRNPVPLVVGGAIVRELGASMPSMPLLLSMKFGSEPLGASKLMNEVWQTDFEVNDQESDHTTGYVQIQFALDYKQPGRGFAIADAHGAMNHHQQVFWALAPYVQAILIHVHVDQASQLVSFVEDLRGGSLAAKPVVVLLRDDRLAKRCKRLQSSQFPDEVLVMSLPDFGRKSEKMKDAASELRKVLMTTEHLSSALRAAHQEEDGNQGDEKDGVCFSRSCLRDMLGDDRLEFPEVDAVIETIKADPDIVGQLAQAHAAFCEESKKISMSNVQDDRETMIQCHKARNERARQLQELCRCSHLAIDKFIYCIGHADAATQIQELVRRSAPVNTLFKELYLLMEEGALPGGLAREGPLALAQYIWAGNPFEILDGDNFHVHDASLKKTFQILDEWLSKESLTLHVESTLGPQSSGKSTLKNSKYGCRFDVSEGRCTRGITGQLVRTEDAALLILDTEGLQSVEKGDAHYDRVMTLLMLAASHLIDVNIKGNMNEPLKRLLEVCVRASMNLKMAKLPSPELHWIFNQVADPNTKHHQDNFRLMKAELAETFAHDCPETFDQIQLHEDNITVVPSMFNEKVAFLGEAAGGETWTRLGISTEYTKKCREMRRDSVMQRDARQQRAVDGQEAFTLQRWLALFADVFRTIQTYPDLTHFQDIRQLRLDRELRSWVDGKLQQTFQSDEGLKDEQAKMHEWCKGPSFEEAESLLNDHFTNHSQDLKQKLKKRCRELGCDAQFSQKLEMVLQSKLETRRSSWQTQLQRHFKEAEVKSACLDGHAKIRQRIRELLRKQEAHPVPMSGEDLEQEFETLWNEVIGGMQGSFRKEEFDYDLLRRLHRVSNSEYRLSFEALHSKKEMLLSAPEASLQPQQGDPDWIVVDQAQPWQNPPEGASWKQYFTEDFLRAVNASAFPGGQQHLCQAEEDSSLQSSDTQARTLFRKRFLSVGWRSAQASPGKRPRPTQPRQRVSHKRPLPEGATSDRRHKKQRHRLAEHLLKQASSSPLTEKDYCAEVMKVIRWQQAFQDLDDRVSHLVDSSRRPDINLVQLVEQAAANTIDELSKALKAVGCKLTRPGMGEFVARALIKSWHLVKDRHFESYMRPIEEMQSEKERQKEYFIASIKQDKDSDKVIAKKRAREVGEVLLSDLTKEGERLLKQVVAKNRPKLSRDVLQEASDACLGTDDIDAQEENILNPANAIERQFDLAFHEVRKEAERAWETGCYMEAEVKLRQIGSHAESVCRLPVMELESTMSEQVFDLRGSHSGGPAVTRAAKRWAASQWFQSAFIDTEQLRQWETPDLWAAGSLSVGVRKGKLRQPFGPLAEETSKDIVRRAWKDSSGAEGGIGCVHVVLREMAAACGEESCSDIKSKLKLKLESQLEAMRSELRSAVVPCRACCPCCGRICDNAELGSEHIHRCSRGHQCRGFKGVYLDDGQKTASTRMCSQVKDKDKYMDEQGCEWTWRDFKASRPDWDFSDKFEERAQEFQARMLAAWKMVGPRICRRFHTHWTPLGEEQTLNHAPTHFILVLDSSGSMASGGWAALHRAVSEMLHARSEVEGSTEDRISAVAFAHSVSTLKRLVTYEDIEQARTTWRSSEDQPMRGGTNFCVALQGAVSILKDCAHQKHHRITLIFMSDGADNNDPGLEKTIQDLKNKVDGRPFSAFTIGFGSPGSFGRLRRVAEMLGGKYVEAVKEMDLKKAFLEVAQRADEPASSA